MTKQESKDAAEIADNSKTATSTLAAGQPIVSQIDRPQQVGCSATPALNTGSPIPNFVIDLLSSCPAHGQGVHSWLFKTAKTLNPLYRDKKDLAGLMVAAASRCGRIVPEREIWNAIQNSQKSRRGKMPHLRPWPELDKEKRSEILKSNTGLQGLLALSPSRFDDDAAHTEEIVDALLPGNPLLCVAKSKNGSDTRPREAWRGQLTKHQFIVPSPMSAPVGRNQEGKLSRRCLENTGPRRFLVIEFDNGGFDDHTALLMHLAQFAPLVLCVLSGGKSLHGWFYCEGQEQRKLHKFMRYAVSLGADRATWTRSQLVRMPDGTRDNGNRQRVVYFNPSLLPKP